jgi:AcrR family transcriptional regulator
MQGAIVVPVTAEALERRRARTRDDILEAAWALCREQGLAQLSLRELAGRVGMRAPSLYSYFDSKDAIYDAMFAQGQHQLAAHMGAVFEQGEGREAFRQGARSFFTFCVEDPVRYFLLFQRVLPNFVPSKAAYALAVDQLARVGHRMVELGVTEPRHLDLWTALLSGLANQQIANDPGGDRWGQLLDEAVDLFCDHVGIP